MSAYRVSDTPSSPFLTLFGSSSTLSCSARVMRDDVGTSKGFGFVSFQTPEEAHLALSMMDGTSLSPLSNSLDSSLVSKPHADSGCHLAFLDHSQASCLVPSRSPFVFTNPSASEQRSWRVERGWRVRRVTTLSCQDQERRLLESEGE